MAEKAPQRTLDCELPVPTVWRPTLKQMADDLVSGRLPSGHDVQEIEADTFKVSLENIRDYPEQIGTLESKAWSTSIYVWSSDYWQVLVDLTTLSGEVSDLVFHVRVYEKNGKFVFVPGLIYVP